MKIKQQFDHLGNTISQVFERCVYLYGERIAVHSSTSSLTYSELNAKANIIAHHLRQYGVKPNTLIAVYLERSIEFIIVILAIIKAGGACIPLDIDVPLNRTRAILTDSNPYKIIINSSQDNDLYPVLNDEEKKNKILDLHTLFKDDSHITNQNLTCINTPHDLLYVMYTSGSTGSPKGCLIPHAGVIGLTKDTNYITIKPDDRIAHTSNIAFDASTFEIWGALLNGATLIIPPKNIFYDINLFESFLTENHITILWLTASIFHEFAEKKPLIFRTLRCLLVGGDVVHSLAVVKVFKALSNALMIVNSYGPTECTTFSTCYLMKSLSDVREPIPIGKPISGKVCLLLDKNLKLVPEGKEGELCIGGLGLAKGYLNQLQLTQEKFILYQLEDGNNVRLYRSGDFARLLPDGNLQFLGRKDRLIKLKGYRINLNEIETSLAKFPGINQVAVIATQNKKRENQLVAYMNFHLIGKRHLNGFRQFLRENLPYYMIPSKIIQLDHMPFTRNGKIDRARLLQLEGQEIFINYEAPSTTTEKIIVETLSQLLDVSRISVLENFFDLGASSLTLARMCAVLNANLYGQKKVNIVDMFSHPTPRLLAEYITEKETPNLNLLKSASERASLQRQKVIEKRGKDGVA